MALAQMHADLRADWRQGVSAVQHKGQESSGVPVRTIPQFVALGRAKTVVMSLLLTAGLH